MTSSRNFELIVFDWDGTLFDSTALISRCIQAACADLGTTVPTDVQASYVIGMGLKEALQHAAPELPEERYRELAERYRHHYFARQHELVFFDGTPLMLRALKARNHLLGVATGKSRRGLDDALNTSVLKGLFDATRTADETASKPDPLMLLELMNELGTEPARAFVLRFDGRLVAYLNRCLHVPTEMDWQYGEFLDSGKEFILCSTHGAAYEPLTGRCAGGPCGRGKLTAMNVEERDGQVYWYPSRDTRPVFAD